MNLDVVRELIRMMEGTSLTAMEVQDAGFRVRLESMGILGQYPPSQIIGGSDGPALIASSQPPVAGLAQPAEQSYAQEEAAPDGETRAANGEPPAGKQLLSPMVGTFHELPEDRRVTVGAKVKKGDAICIVEAMKVMNEITMEEDGVISYIAAKEGDMVEYGQILYVFD